MKSPQKRSIIIASNIPSDIDFCSRLSSLVGLDLIRVNGVEQLESILVGRKDSFLFFDFDQKSKVGSIGFPFKLVLPIISRMTEPSCVIALTEDSTLRVGGEYSLSSIGHFISRKYDAFALAWMSKVLSVLPNGQSFEPIHLLLPEGDLKTITLSASGEKAVAIEAFRRFLTREGNNSRAIEVVLTGLDELIMNAIFDAPKDAMGKHYRREVSREKDFALSDKEKVTLTLIQNPTFTVLGVSDSFGSITLSRTQEAALKNYQTEAYALNPKTKSAHLGLHGISRGGATLLIWAVPGISTHAFLIFSELSSLRSLRQSFRGFSLVGMN